MEIGYLNSVHLKIDFKKIGNSQWMKPKNVTSNERFIVKTKTVDRKQFYLISGLSVLYLPLVQWDANSSWELSSLSFQVNKEAVMSLSTARSFLSEACYGEQELDANSALMELDKGTLASLLAS